MSPPLPTLLRWPGWPVMCTGPAVIPGPPLVQEEACALATFEFSNLLCQAPAAEGVTKEQRWLWTEGRLSLPCAWLSSALLLLTTRGPCGNLQGLQVLRWFFPWAPLSGFCHLWMVSHF